jgi:hypothetical protein
VHNLNSIASIGYGFGAGMMVMMASMALGTAVISCFVLGIILWGTLSAVMLALIGIACLVWNNNTFYAGSEFSGDVHANRMLEQYNMLQHDPSLEALARPALQNVLDDCVSEHNHPGTYASWASYRCDYCIARINEVKGLVSELKGPAGDPDEDLKRIQNFRSLLKELN